MSRRYPAVIFATALAASPAAAIIGGTAAGPAAEHAVLIVSTRGAVCSGTAIARDLVLSAAHCVAPPADYAVVRHSPAGPTLLPVDRIALHPKFDQASFRTRRPTPDLALLKMKSALPAELKPARLAQERALPRAGDRFLLAGFGQAHEGDARSAGTLRTLALPAVGTTGGIMVRLSTSASEPRGSCHGDSGGGVFREEAAGMVLAAVIGWATGPRGRECGAVTGATLVSMHRDWIDAAAQSLGGRVAQ